MVNNSIWLAGMDEGKVKILSDDIYVDVLIVGGGITGLSTAYYLKDSPLKTCVVEANLIGHGVTSKTTGKLTYLQETIYSTIKKGSNEETAKMYYEGQKDAISKVIKIIEDNNIECDFYKNTSFTFTKDSMKVEKLKEERKLLKKFGSKVYEGKVLPDGTECEYYISVDDTYVFHPLKYLSSLKKIISKSKIDIYEKSRVLSIDYVNGYYICKTARAFVKAKQVVMAMHYPYFLKPFFMPMKVMLEKSYIGAFHVLNNLKFNAISVDKPVTSIRYHQNKNNIYEIFLYGSHNICTKYNEKDNFSKLRSVVGKVDYLWSNIDVITGDRIPYVGKIDKQLFLGTGYNTWGMTNGSLAGFILSEQVLGRKTKYDDFYNPKRALNIGRLVQYPLVFGSNIKSYLDNGLFKNKSWYEGKVRFEERNGKGVAIYTDIHGVEHIVYRKCPHLKCNLIFNQVEETWDCPCHGSRFTIDGYCISGPSNYDVCYKEE